MNYLIPVWLKDVNLAIERLSASSASAETHVVATQTRKGSTVIGTLLNPYRVKCGVKVTTSR